MKSYVVGDNVQVRGYITSELWVRGRSLKEMEELLGFAFGRMAQGLTLVALTRVPAANEFELAGYTYTPKHRFSVSPGIDVAKLKTMLLREKFTSTGGDRLVKVIPAIGHDPKLPNDAQYPFGHGGASQWKLTSLLPGRVVAVAKGYPDGKVTPVDFKPAYKM